MNTDFAVQYLLLALDKIGALDKPSRLQGRMMQQVGAATIEAYTAEIDRGEDSRATLAAIFNVQISLVLGMMFSQCRPARSSALPMH